ncbi:aldehyde dehydrogenase family protein [Candidatus Woesearchaeota archaeon]|nr:aldehyde dehydrogenase family protein [Candidatus Woesearchaeota archaeon]
MSLELKSKIENVFPTEIPKEFQFAVARGMMEGLHYLINGEIVPWSGETCEVFSPVCVNRDGKLEPFKLADSPMMDEATALRALDAADKAYDEGRGVWPQMSLEQRTGCIKNFVRLMKQERDTVVALEMLEIGKTKKDCEKEFDRTVEYIERTVDTMGDLKKYLSEAGTVGSVARQPHGTMLCMGPFNYPLNETFTVLIPALAMGNTVVVKGPKMGMLCSVPLYDAFRQSLPDGVINFINGDGRTVVTPIMKSGKLDAFAFIGGSGTYDAILKSCPNPRSMYKNAGLEAKNAAIILPDADLESTVKECVSGALSFNGQRCTALKILYVHESIADDFVKKYSEAVSKLSVGMPWENPNITPVPDLASAKRFKELVDDAVGKGAKVVNECGGVANQTMFFPAVLYPVNDSMRIYREEQFGPVSPVAVYSSVDGPIDAINNSRYGQQVSIFGTHEGEIAHVVRGLKNAVSRININTQCMRGPDSFPFTGRKDSAVETLSITDALLEFSRPVVVASSEKNAELVKRLGELV